jgi:hypothetical protein
MFSGLSSFPGKALEKSMSPGKIIPGKMHNGSCPRAWHSLTFAKNR